MILQKRALDLVVLIILVVVLTISCFGCAPQNQVTPAPTQPAADTPTPASDDIQQIGEDAADDQTGEAESLTVTDMAGRTVMLPDYSVSRIFCADPMSAITLYTLAPDMLLGWNYPLNDLEAAYILEEYRNLPVYGMKDAINYEAVIAAGPDIALLTGTISDGLVEQADKMMKKLGIPVLVLDNRLDAAPEVYAFLGSVTGMLDQGSTLSTYANDTLSAIPDIDGDDRVSIYYANGIDSLNTSSKGSPASQVFDMVGAENVCDLPSDAGDRIQVTKEHVIAWNPDYIFVNGEPTESLSGASAAQKLMSDYNLANVAAVQNGNVVSIPKAPFAWVDRPRSINRLIGIRWLGSMLYPNSYTFTNDDIKEFYKLFYHMELTDDQLSDLLSQ